MLYIHGRCLVNLAIFVQLICTSYPAVCSSNEYCPPGWSVLRNEDLSARTCDPMHYEIKCERPYSCVHSKCGISFCCVSPDKLARWKLHLELEQELKENSFDEL